ncbi:hypothetical protein M5689_000812 [Euphorbia peplus]|nr:hypothetical protein M5689_000812 [Euphorbia peplus]
MQSSTTGIYSPRYNLFNHNIITNCFYLAYNFKYITILFNNSQRGEEPHHKQLLHNHPYHSHNQLLQIHPHHSQLLLNHPHHNQTQAHQLVEEAVQEEGEETTEEEDQEEEGQGGEDKVAADQLGSYREYILVILLGYR